ncbi:hypothetical protein [Arthrobacter sp. YAF16]|uniref:hypothetical protein n=1 Tax=Arthrobacter sp. YAF16 TaxID=3233076 RepID=UPI003F93D446
MTHSRAGPCGKGGRWPLVPAGVLYRLRAALSQCVELAGSETAHELLTLVSAELERRESPEHPHPLFPPR